MRRFVIAALSATILLAACSGSSNNGTGTGSGSTSEKSSSTRSSARSSVRSVARSSVSSIATQDYRSSDSSFGYFRRNQSSSALSGATYSSTGYAQSAVSSVGGYATSSSIAPVSAGAVRVFVDANPKETIAGGEVGFTVTVRNASASPLNDIQAVFSFSPQQVIVVESNGTIQSDHIQWAIPSMAANEKRTFVVRGQLRPDLPVGAVVRTNLIAIRNAAVEPSTSTADVHVISHMPRTGPGDGTRPFSDPRRFLTPVSSNPVDVAIPAIVWAALILLCVSAGTRMGKRYL